MGLEMIGFARANMDDIWIDPVEYKEQLAEATLPTRPPRSSRDDLQPSALPH